MKRFERELILCEAMETVRLASQGLSTGKVVKRADAVEALASRRPTTAWDRAIALAWAVEAEAQLLDALAAAYGRTTGQVRPKKHSTTQRY